MLGDEQADFGERYWRAAPAIPDPLPPLTADAVDAAAFRLLADAIPTLCWIANGDGYIVWYNRRWHEYCGTTPQAMEGWGWTAVHDPEVLPAVMDRWTASVATGDPFEMTFPLRGADGRFRPFLTRVQPVRDAGGAVVRWFGVNTDISRQVAAEDLLRQERDRSRNVLENMGDAYVFVDAGFRVQEINRKALHMEVRSRNSILGQAMWDVWPGIEATEIGSLYKHAMATRVPVSLEHSYTWSDGRAAWIEMRAYPSGDGLAIFYRDVTARRQAEAALQESEEHYRHIVEFNPQVVWTAQPDGKLDNISCRWMDWTGVDALGDGWGAAMHPDDLQPTRDALAGAVAAGTPYHIEHRVRMRSGAYRWLSTSAYPRRDAGGTVVKWHGYTRDVHDRKTAEAALMASEARLRGITDSIDHMVWSTQPDGYHDYYNQRWYEYTGVPPGSTDGEAWNGMFHPDDQDRAWSVWRHSLATGEPYRIEYRLRHRTGQYRWVLGRAQAVRDVAGQIIRWYGTCTDIQDAVEAREVLARSRMELEALVQERTAERDRTWANTQDLLVVLDAEGIILAVNPAWATLLGWRMEEVVGQHHLRFNAPDDHAGSASALQAVLHSPLHGYTSRVVCRDGSYRWVSWVASAEAGRVYASGRDVTAERAAQDALHQTEEALRQSQKMEAVGQLTGGIAHDFNNMLAVVIGSLDLLVRRLGDANPRAQRLVAAAMEGARRAATLTERLLAFSRQQPLQPESIDANRLVAGMSDLLGRSLGGDIRLETVLAGGLWRTHADPNGLENAILNLSVNARDAMPGGGRLTIETANAHLDDAYAATHLGVPAGQYVLIAVTDTGTGMAPDVAARAFDPFFTTKEVGRGTGLGLSQVYGFVKQSGGHVKIYSEPGQGTAVKIYLPRQLGDVADTPARGAAPTLATGGSDELVLVVEDEPGVRRFSVEALRELGYAVLEAESAAEALRLLDATPAVALLFTDVVMPDTNGRKLADEARRRRPGLRVLFTTGYTRNAVVHNGVLDPGVHLIGKPFTIEALAAKVREVLDAPG